MKRNFLLSLQVSSFHSLNTSKHMKSRELALSLWNVHYNDIASTSYYCSIFRHYTYRILAQIRCNYGGSLSSWSFKSFPTLLQFWRKQQLFRELSSALNGMLRQSGNHLPSHHSMLKWNSQEIILFQKLIVIKKWPNKWFFLSLNA